jgi:ABC-type hemin transport system ATPase subunit
VFRNHYRTSEAKEEGGNILLLSSLQASDMYYDKLVVISSGTLDQHEAMARLYDRCQLPRIYNLLSELGVEYQPAHLIVDGCQLNP